VDVSICNVVEGLSAHMLSSRTCHTHIHFKLEIAKQLIAGYSVRKSYAGKKRKATPLTMPYPSQTYWVIRKSRWKDKSEHASAAQSMARETLQGALQRQFMAAIAVVSTCVRVGASCSITLR